MRVLLAAIECQKGDIAGNLAAHAAILDSAAADHCDLVLFPEMSLTGSVDPAANPERLIGLEHAAVSELTRATDGQSAACFGIAEGSADGLPCITQVLAAGGR